MHDFGSLVAGGELAYNRLSFNDYTGHVHNGLLRLKGGYDLGHYMPYVAVGVGHLSGGSDGFSEVGPAFGVGVSLKTAENVTVSAEYTWQKVTHDYKRPVIVFGRPPERFETVQTDLRTGLFQTKISFKF